MKNTRTRNNQFAIRLSDNEIELFNKKQTASGLSKTDFFVKLLNNSKIKIYCFNEALKILYNELRRIGVNLNQIAYLANIGRDYEFKSELYRMSEAYFSVMDRLKSFLEKPLVNAYIIDEVPQKQTRWEMIDWLLETLMWITNHANLLDN